MAHDGTGACAQPHSPPDSTQRSRAPPAPRRDQYFVEYTVEKIPGPKRHLYSTVALAWNGRYNRLYTLTGQCLEEALPQYEGALRSVLQSFQPPAPASA